MSKRTGASGTIDLAILGLLQEEDLHGYELRKRLGDIQGAHNSVSFGSLYPALARLERSGAVQVLRPSTSPQPTSPMTGALSGELAAFRATQDRSTAKTPTALDGAIRDLVHGRRTKKVYGITASGSQQLLEMLSDQSGDDRTFRLKVAFCRHMGPPQRVSMLIGRRDTLIRRLDELKSRAPATTDAYLSSLERHDLTTLDNDITWLDELIETARADSRMTDPEGAESVDPTAGREDPSPLTLETQTGGNRQ